ncbi:DUF6350 family protein [Microbacterium sp. NPDC019599]|uniref:cell division protein PerM n=1 Tax=Microbacterium sp. NPDC019599 TaxID=3154690 RepID=UPI0033DAF807
MHRLIVAFLSAFDAAIAVAAGIAATLAPLTVLWVFALGDTADWGALWPVSAVVWQLGHLVPLTLTLPGEYLAETGITEDAASFVLSLAPLAFASFTAIFAARSGARASRAGGWMTGVGVSTVATATLATLIALSSQNAVAAVTLWQAIVFPTLVFAVPALMGAVATEWREAPDGLIARLRDRVESAPGWWGAVPGVAVRASAAAVAGLVGAGALVLSVAFLLRGGEIVALYQAANLDALGAIVVTLAQAAYLPTLVVWGVSFVAGPGFSVGEGTAVSPSGTQSGVMPGVPVLGLIPESSSPWLLLVVLLPIAVGAVAGWIARSRLLAAAGIPPRVRTRRVKADRTDAVAPASDAGLDIDSADAARRAALAELLTRPPLSASAGPGEARDAEAAADGGAAMDREVDPEPRRAVHVAEPVLPRIVVTLAIAALAAGAAAALAVFASGSLGPGRLALVGPEPGPVALAVGVEVLVGAAILLLSPRSGDRDDSLESEASADRTTAVPGGAAAPTAEADTAPICGKVAEPGAGGPDAPPLGAASGSGPASRPTAPAPLSGVSPAHPTRTPAPITPTPTPAAPPAAPPPSASEAHPDEVDPHADTAPIDLPPSPGAGGDTPSVD